MKERLKLRLASYPSIPILIGIIGVSIALGVCMYFVLDYISQQIDSIIDPTERGLAYIAAAIVLHACFGKSRVNVKTNKI